MSKKSHIKPLSIVLGTAFIASMAASNVASAAQGANPFAMNELSSGYMQVADKGMEGSCGGKKGMDKKMEGSCGEAKKKMEGSCGGKKGMDKKMEGSCGGDKKDMKAKKAKKEGKCGEGKCGGKK